MDIHPADSGSSLLPPPLRRWMVPVDGRAACAGLIRKVHALAKAEGIPWLAVHLEASKRFRYSQAYEERLAEHLRLAERLGAEVVQIQPSGLRAAPDFLALARERRVTTLLLGRSRRPRWLNRFTGSLLEDLVDGSPELEIRIVPTDPDPRPAAVHGLALGSPQGRTLGTVALVVLAATLLGVFIHRVLGLADLADLAMLYMLCITIVAARFGRWAALLATGLSVAGLDFFFIPPHFTFAVADLRHLGTFAMMLGAGWVTANLAEQIRAQTRIALDRDRATGALYRLGAVVAEEGSPQVLRERVEAHLRGEYGAPVLVLLADAQGTLETHEAAGTRLNAEELATAQWALEQGRPSGRNTATVPGSRALFMPLAGAERPVGVMALFGDAAGRKEDSEHQNRLAALASQVSLALERARLAEERAEARIRAEHEHLRSTLLSSLSHDLRTPLGTITGITTTLLDPGPGASPEDQRMLLATVNQEAFRLQRLVNNLLDLTRLESGHVKVSKEWIPVEEVVGSAVSRMEEQLGDRPLELRLPEAWVPLDPVLFEQVLINVLDNALKFSPPGSPIEIRGTCTESRFRLEIADRGPGIPPGEEERVFDKLYRGTGARSVPGAGLGLAICRGILQAHGGAIRAGQGPGGGALVTLELPIEGLPPEVPGDLNGGEQP